MAWSSRRERDASLLKIAGAQHWRFIFSHLRAMGMEPETRRMKILMVCLGNICRSPMAEGILRHRAQEAGLDLSTDSAGTSGYHIGEAPDHRATRALQGHGIDISDLRARQFTSSDFQRFDLIFAMDTSNLDDMLELASTDALAAKAKLVMDLVPENALRSVPDPYYGGHEGFEQVYHMLDEACIALVQQLQARG
jgi:protein-tyrosine phosphatase